MVRLYGEKSKEPERLLNRVAAKHICGICGNYIGKGEPARKFPKAYSGGYTYEHYPCCGQSRFERQDIAKKKKGTFAKKRVAKKACKRRK